MRHVSLLSFSLFSSLSHSRRNTSTGLFVVQNSCSRLSLTFSRLILQSVGWPIVSLLYRLVVSN